MGVQHDIAAEQQLLGALLIDNACAEGLLEQLKPGARIVSHRFGLGDWKPDRTVKSDGHELLLWIVPGR